MNQSDGILLLVNVFTALLNLGFVALNLKLYTEYIKDRSQEGRGRVTR